MLKYSMFPHNQEVLFTRQKHEADRAGKHYDYRIVVGDKAYSWATKKEIPKEGKSIILHQQPVHTADYALSKKVVIPKGQYGAGVTTLDWVKKGKVSNEENSKDKFVIESGGDRFLIKHVPDYGDKMWLFKNLGKKTKQEKNKYLKKVHTLEKSAMLITQYEHNKTHEKVWKPEGYHPGVAWKPTGAKKYIRKKQRG